MLEIDGTTKNSLPVNKKDGSIWRPPASLMALRGKVLSTTSRILLVLLGPGRDVREREGQQNRSKQAPYIRSTIW